MRVLVHEEAGLFGSRDAITGQSLTWFVYTLPSSDCSTFKVGFSCNPLQRFHTFSPRYYERFDLCQSRLLPLTTCDAARAIEAALKSDLAPFRADAPGWVPIEAGGHTEWFSAVQITRAEERLIASRSGCGVEHLAVVEDYLRSELTRLSLSFESWALSQARQIDALTASPRSRDLALAATRTLRDWLDGYRYFDIPLFVDDPVVRDFVVGVARAA